MIKVKKTNEFLLLLFFLLLGMVVTSCGETKKESQEQDTKQLEIVINDSEVHRHEIIDDLNNDSKEEKTSDVVDVKNQKFDEINDGCEDNTSKKEVYTEDEIEESDIEKDILDIDVDIKDVVLDENSKDTNSGADSNIFPNVDSGIKYDSAQADSDKDTTVEIYPGNNDVVEETDVKKDLDVKDVSGLDYIKDVENDSYADTKDISDLFVGKDSLLDEDSQVQDIIEEEEDGPPGNYPVINYTSVTQLGIVHKDGLYHAMKDPQTLKHGYYGDKAIYYIYENAKWLDESTKKWCGNDFGRYRVFVPSSKDIPVFDMTIGIVPNSSIYMLMHFIPVKNPPSMIDGTQTKYWSTITREDLKKFFKGELSIVQRVVDVRETMFSKDRIAMDHEAGWLYIEFIGTSYIETSQYQTNSYEIFFAFSYGTIAHKLTEEDINRFLSHTYFDPQSGDPIEGFKWIVQKTPYCYKYGAKELISGKTHGVLGTQMQ